MIKEEDYNAWRANPVTMAVMGLLANQVKDIRTAWSEGEEWNDIARGAVEVRTDILNLTHEDLMEALSENEQLETV